MLALLDFIGSSAFILLLAIVLDGFFGEPRWIYRHISHPAILLGRLVELLDKRLNRDEDRLYFSNKTMRFRGVCALLTLIFFSILVGEVLSTLITLLPDIPAFILEATLVSTLIAQRSLHDHVKQVATALGTEGLEGGRTAVSMIVGRDPSQLDEPGVCRAAIESLAENFSDGVIAPCFFYLLFGLPGLILYKAVNTADSMIGHRTEKWEQFGWASARFDDLLNYIPARLSGVLIILAAMFKGGKAFTSSWTVMFRDAHKHRSPNAGWPESATAGALNIKLSGPRAYGDHKTEEPWVGDGTSDLTPRHIEQGLRLIWSAYGFFVVMLIANLMLIAPV